jgi:transcriptional regulator with XRE-family HTH domain
MHEFYQRMKSVFERAGSNRNRFCKKYGYSYQTLQAYWNTDKLPPGNVLEDLAREFNVSLDALVLGRNTQELPVDNPLLSRVIRFLVGQDPEELLRIEGALRMYQAMPLSGIMASRGSDQLPERSKTMESLTQLLVELGGHIQTSRMSPEDKQASKEMLNRIVLNIYEQDVAVKDEWAELEEIE